MDTKYYKDQFKNINTDALLDLRSKGPDLMPEAHQAIEEILSDRGDEIPPIPEKPLKKPSEATNLLKDIIAFICGGALALAILTLVTYLSQSNDFYRKISNYSLLYIIVLSIFSVYLRRKLDKNQ